MSQEINYNEAIEQRLQEIEKTMNEVKTALIGDVYHDGFKQRIEKIEIDMPLFKKLVWMAVGGTSTLSLVALIISILKHLL